MMKKILEVTNKLILEGSDEKSVVTYVDFLYYSSITHKLGSRYDEHKNGKVRTSHIDVQFAKVGLTSFWESIIASDFKTGELNGSKYKVLEVKGDKEFVKNLWVTYKLSDKQPEWENIPEPEEPEWKETKP